jgi:hypothetical protein
VRGVFIGDDSECFRRATELSFQVNFRLMPKPMRNVVPRHLTHEEVEGVGFNYSELSTMMRLYDPAKLQQGWNCVQGEEIYFIENPGLGLWAARDRLEPSQTAHSERHTSLPWNEVVLAQKLRLRLYFSTCNLNDSIQNLFPHLGNCPASRNHVTSINIDDVRHLLI